MCSCNQPRPNNPPWHRTVGNFAVRNRDTLRGVAALAVLLAALAGVLFYSSARPTSSAPRPTS